MTANFSTSYGCVPWPPVKAEPSKPTMCCGDLRRAEILRTQALPDPGHMLAPSREHSLVEPYAERKQRLARERGEMTVVVEPPRRRTRKPMTPEHKAAISAGVRRAARIAAGKRAAGRPCSGSSRRPNGRLRRGESRAISAGSRARATREVGSQITKQ